MHYATRLLYFGVSCHQFRSILSSISEYNTLHQIVVIYLLAWFSKTRRDVTPPWWLETIGQTHKHPVLSKFTILGRSPLHKCFVNTIINLNWYKQFIKKQNVQIFRKKCIICYFLCVIHTINLISKLDV